MQAGVGAIAERKVEAEHGDPMRREHGRQLLDARLIGPHATADRQCFVIDPHAIAALDRSGRNDLAQDRNAGGLIGGCVQGGFGHAAGLAHAQDDRAMVGHQGGIMGEHRVGKSVAIVLDPHDLRAAGGHQIGKGAELFDSACSVKSGAIVPVRRLGRKQALAGLAHGHPLQRRGHRL